MKLNLLLSLLFVLFFLSCSQKKELLEMNPEYLEELPAPYRINAHSTVRDSESILSIFNESTASYYSKGAVTIHNEKHRDKGEFLLFYDDFRKVSSLKVQVINDYGEVLSMYTLDDAEDFSASGSSFFTDARVKVLTAYASSYPYTVQYEYQYDYSATLNLPDWYPLDYYQSLENSSFEIRDYTRGGVRHHSRNHEIEPEVNVLSSYVSTRWELNNQIAKKSEAYSPPYQDIFPSVVTAASTFNIASSRGDASTWRSFGKWYYDLSAGKRELPLQAKKEIDELLKNATSEEEKVYLLYDYLQDTNRYVSIQLGLGGWEPYSAEYVYNNKYGDCKALVNFMHALLEYAGIEAEPALISSGVSRPKLISDFPSNQFNHVILRVTLSDGNVIWLECTSKYIKPGKIGIDNEGKEVLIVNETGGRIGSTDYSSNEDNVQISKSRITISEDGNAVLSTKVKKNGLMEDVFLHQLNPISQKQREMWLEEEIALSSFEVNSYSFGGLDKDESDTNYEVNLSVKNFANTTQKRLFIPLNKINRWNIYIPNDNERSTAVHLPYKFTEVDSTTFILPSGYKPESFPRPIEIESDFGSFKVNLEFNTEDGTVDYKRELKVHKNNLSVEEYQQFKDFFTEVNKTDRVRFVVVKED